MKFAIQTIAYKEERFIKRFIEYYKYMVDEILVLNSTVPYYGREDKDKAVDWTKEYAEQAGARVVQGTWAYPKDQRNDGLDLLKDHDWIFILDPDEYYAREDFERLKKVLSTANGNAYVSKMHTYWQREYKIEPPEGHRPCVAVRAKSKVRFAHSRGINESPHRLPDSFILHHFSWVRSDKEVWRKISHYGHSNEFDVHHWFQEKWVRWTPGTMNFHPISPPQYHKAVKVTNLPEEIKEIHDEFAKYRND
jgi:hypothetical protein